MIWLTLWVLGGLVTTVVMVKLADRDLKLDRKDFGDLSAVGFFVLAAMLIWPILWALGGIGWLTLKLNEVYKRRRTNSLPLEDR